LSREQEYLLPLATKVQEHFQSLRCPSTLSAPSSSPSNENNNSINRSSRREMIISLDDDDGIAMGEALMMTMKRARAGGNKKKKNIVAAAVKRFISEYKAMSMLSNEFTWIEVMLVEILSKKVMTRKAKKVESKLECLENEGARQIGTALIAIVVKSINENVGVHDWIEKYPSMKTLCERHSFIAPMMEVVATQTVRAVDWMMLVEAAGNTAVSFFDLATDLYMIYFYFANDQASFGKSLRFPFFLKFSSCIFPFFLGVVCHF
jgi:ribosomal protein L14